MNKKTYLRAPEWLCWSVFHPAPSQASCSVGSLLLPLPLPLPPACELSQINKENLKKKFLKVLLGVGLEERNEERS